MTSKRIGFLILAVAVGTSGMTHAQAITGTVTGTVQDLSGAVVPRANITLTNEASLDARRTVANNEGFYSIAAVPAGTYSVLIEVKSFASWKRTGIVLRGGDRVNVTDIQLKPGMLDEEITITEQIPLAPIDSGEKSTTITQQQLQDLSIVGRSAAELLKILPGMTRSIGQWSNPTLEEDARNVAGYTGEVLGINGSGEGGRQSAIGSISANGNRPEAMEIVIDNAHAADPGCNCATSVNPNPEMIGEFKVLTSNYSAEHSKGPVALSFVSRSGGREFHGSLYSYLRNYSLNANEWALNRAGKGRPESKFFYPGATLGGPLLIPGTSFNTDRDKVFFFLGAEVYRQALDTGLVTSWVPTGRMRNGDFSNFADYANLGAGFCSATPNNLDANGRIPADQIDSNAQILMNLLPMPNADPLTNNGYNYVDVIVSNQNGYQGFGRIDVSISDNTKMFLRYARQRETQPFAVGFWWRENAQVPYPTLIEGRNRSDSVTATLTHVFSPTLTSETIFGLTYINFPTMYQDPSKVSRSALGYTYEGFLGPPDPYVPSITAWGSGPTFFNIGDFENFFAKKWMISGAQNITKVAGTHMLKAGLFYEWVQNAQPHYATSNGILEMGNWAADSTDNYFSDLLTGTLANYGDATPNPVGDIAYNVMEVYFQDSWKVTPRLTLELGLRASHLPGWHENRYDVGIPVWDDSAYRPTATPAERSGMRWHAQDPSIPMTGVKRPFVLLAPRFGFAYDLSGTGETVIRGGIGLFRFNEHQSFYGSSVSQLLGQVFQDTGSIRLSEVDTWLERNELAAAGRTGIIAIDITDKTQPGTTSWSVTLQKRLLGQIMMEASYVGNHQFRIANCDNLCSADINAVPMGAMLADPTGNGDDFRPRQNYTWIDAVKHNFYMNYHSGQLMLSRQTGNFNFMASYTFSKVLGMRRGNKAGATGVVVDASGQLLDLRETTYGVLRNDRTHVINLAYSWLLPKIEGNVFLNAICGEWQISGISSLVSGAPLQAISGGGNFNITGTLPDGSAISDPAITGSPQVRAQAVLICDPRQGLSSDQMLNPSCFQLPTPGTNGNYIQPHANGQWYQNHDLSIFKNFSLGGAKKLQLRFSAYNVLNMAQRFPDPNKNMTLRYENGVLANSDEFGVLPLDNKYGRRIVQLAAKFFF